MMNLKSAKKAKKESFSRDKWMESFDRISWMTRPLVGFRGLNKYKESKSTRATGETTSINRID